MAGANILEHASLEQIIYSLQSGIKGRQGAGHSAVPVK